MKDRFRLAKDETKTALVILFPPQFKGLFNPEVHRFVGAVQEQLDIKSLVSLELASRSLDESADRDGFQHSQYYLNQVAGFKLHIG